MLFFFQAEDGIRYRDVTGVQTCALPIYPEEKDQINNYHFYNKDGDKNGVSLGSLFDRKG